MVQVLTLRPLDNDRRLKESMERRRRGQNPLKRVRNVMDNVSTLLSLQLRDKLGIKSGVVFSSGLLPLARIRAALLDQLLAIRLVSG